MDRGWARLSPQIPCKFKISTHRPPRTILPIKTMTLACRSGINWEIQSLQLEWTTRKMSLRLLESLMGTSHYSSQIFLWSEAYFWDSKPSLISYSLLKNRPWSTIRRTKCIVCQVASSLTCWLNQLNLLWFLPTWLRCLSKCGKLMTIDSLWLLRIWLSPVI